MFQAADFEELQDYSVALLGPLLNGYFAALHARCQARGTPMVGFVSREGVFLHTAFRAFCEARGIDQPSVAIPASRSLLLKLLLDEGSIDDLSQTSFQGSFARLLSDRLSIHDWPDRIDMAAWSRVQFDLPCDGAQLRALWPFVQAAVAPRITEKKAAYCDMLASLGFIDGSIVADVGYSGSLQALLGWILERPIDSFYIASTTKQKRYRAEYVGNHDALFAKIGAFNQGLAILDNSLLLEVVMSADHGQVDDYDDCGGMLPWSFRYGPRGRSQYGYALLEIMQTRAIAYLRETADVPLAALVDEKHRTWLYRYLNRMMSMPAMAPRLLVEVGDVDDRISGLGFVNPWHIPPKFQ